MFPLSSLGICFGFYASSIAGAQGRSSPALRLLTQPPLSSTCLGLWWEMFAEHDEGRIAFLGYSKTCWCVVQAIVYW